MMELDKGQVILTLDELCDLLAQSYCDGVDTAQELLRVACIPKDTIKGELKKKFELLLDSDALDLQEESK